MGCDASERRRGFTLVELLVAIGITGVLMAFLLSTLRAVWQRSLLLQCQTNLRQYGQAMVVYSLDNHSYVPRDSFSASSAFFAPHLAKIMRVQPAADETIVQVGPYKGARVQVDRDYCIDWLRA